MFHESLDPPGPADDAWGAHDLIGALLARDRIEQAILAIPETASEPPPTLAVADELFRVLTVPDEEQLLLEAHSTRGDSWWWQRVPKNGPVTRDLNEWRNHRLAQEQVDKREH